MLKQKYHFKFIILIIIFSCALCLLIGLYKAFALPHIKAYFEARKSLETKSLPVSQKQGKVSNPNTDNKPVKSPQSVMTNSNNINYIYKETAEEKRLREKQLKKEIKASRKQLKHEAKEEKKQAKQEAKTTKQKIKEEQKLKKKNNEVQEETSSSTQYSEVIPEE